MAVYMDAAECRDSFRSWLVVFGAALALFCTVGFVNAFGVFQEYYMENLEGYSASDISWIGSVSLFVFYAGSAFIGILVDRIGPAVPLYVGSIAELVAVFMTSLCTEYYQIFLAQAVLLGISMALIINPSLAVVSRRLARRRGLALGLVLGGSSIGGVVWPIMLERLLSHDQVSFGWTLRAVAFTMIPLLAIACLTVKEAPEIPPSPSEMISDGPEASQTETQDEKPVKKKTDLSILKNPAFDLLCAGLAIGYLGLFAPTFYISSFAISNGVSSQLAFYLLSVYNAGSFFGRVLPGHWADRFGHFNICTLSVFVSGITGFCWISAKSPAGLTVWTLAYGFASGAVMSLQGACAGKVAGHHSQGTAVGLMIGSVAVTALVGTPIAGQLVDNYGYLALSMYTGATLFAGGIVCAIARWKLDHSVFVVV